MGNFEKRGPYVAWKTSFLTPLGQLILSWSSIFFIVTLIGLKYSAKVHGHSTTSGIWMKVEKLSSGPLLGERETLSMGPLLGETEYPRLKAIEPAS